MKDILFKAASIALIVLLCFSFYATAQQNIEPTQENEPLEWLPVTNSNLDALRGGFVLNNGVIVDISFQKNVFRNGELISHSYFQSPQDNSLLTSDELNLASLLPNSSLQTVLQNTLDNQTLSAITNIDISIKNLKQAEQAFLQNELYSSYFGTGRP